MALIYQFKGAGYGLPITSGGSVRLQRRIDIPALVALGVQSGLAYTSAPNTGVALPSTGFADGDFLEVFWLPKGTIVTGVGVRKITAEGATATMDVGVQSATETLAAQDIDGAGVFDIDATGLDGTADNDGWGSDNLPAGELYITDGSLDIEFNHDDIETAIFQIWADVKLINE